MLKNSMGSPINNENFGNLSRLAQPYFQIHFWQEKILAIPFLESKPVQSFLFTSFLFAFYLIIKLSSYLIILENWTRPSVDVNVCGKVKEISLCGIGSALRSSITAGRQVIVGGWQVQVTHVWSRSSVRIRALDQRSSWSSSSDNGAEGDDLEYWLGGLFLHTNVVELCLEGLHVRDVVLVLVQTGGERGFWLDDWTIFTLEFFTYSGKSMSSSVLGWYPNSSAVYLTRYRRPSAPVYEYDPWTTKVLPSFSLPACCTEIPFSVLWLKR